jgi:hypothetical protein
MRSFFVRVCAPMVLAATISAFAGAPAAGALSPDAHAARFVGTYTVRFKISGQQGVHLGLLAVKAGGTASDNTGRTATWSNTGPVFTLVYVDPKVAEVFTARETQRGLASRKNPGTYTSNGDPDGIWWAVKTSS